MICVPVLVSVDPLRVSQKGWKVEIYNRNIKVMIGKISLKDMRQKQLITPAKPGVLEAGQTSPLKSLTSMHLLSRKWAFPGEEDCRLPF